MKKALVTIATVGLVWSASTGAVLADKMSELKTVAAQMAEARNTLDAATICANLHDDVTALGPNTMFPSRSKAIPFGRVSGSSSMKRELSPSGIIR